MCHTQKTTTTATKIPSSQIHHTPPSCGRNVAHCKLTSFLIFFPSKIEKKCLGITKNGINENWHSTYLVVVARTGLMSSDKLSSSLDRLVDVLRTERSALMATGLDETVVEAELLTRLGCKAGEISCEPSVVPAGCFELRPHESQRVRKLLGAIDQALAIPSSYGSSTSSASAAASPLAPESVCKILESFAARVTHTPVLTPSPLQPAHAPSYVALVFESPFPPKKGTSPLLCGEETCSSSPSPSPSAKRSKLRDTRPV
jgi:hypothetical protein